MGTNIKCPHCHKSDRVNKYGKTGWKTIKQRYACLRCRKTFYK
jgi:transposase-like protein